MKSIRRNFYRLEIESRADFHSVHGCSDFIVRLHCKPLTNQEAIFLDRVSLTDFIGGIPGQIHLLGSHDYLTNEA